MMIEPEKFKKEREYCAAVAVAKRLLSAGYIDRSEYDSLNGAFVDRYRPAFKFAGAEPIIFQGDEPAEKPDLT